MYVCELTRHLASCSILRLDAASSHHLLVGEPGLDESTILIVVHALEGHLPQVRRM